MFPLYDTNPTIRWPVLTVLLIAINVGVMFYQESLNRRDYNELIAHRGFVPARIAQLSNPQLVVNVKVDDGELGGQVDPANVRVIPLKADAAEIYISCFTMMFLHGGWWHLIANMWFLFIFGNNIEDRLGHFFFLLFYLAGGLLALAAQWLLGPQAEVPVIGASGAVAAVLGGYAVTFPTAKVRTLIFIFFVDLPALVVLGFWFVQQLISGLQMDVNSVAWWAHVGGFAAGAILMPLMALGTAPTGENWKEEADRMFGPVKS